MDNSDKQMEMLLEEGGVSDDGMSVDPVSGNEIPPGSLATEVRDDIPAMLSEGEYVVPADVLRFYGVKFFEDLRTEAKMGLSGMEQNGRIGGEPVMEEELPFSDEELMTVDGKEEPIQMNEGGVAAPQATASSSSLYQQDPEDPTQVLMGGGGSTGYELITYYGPNGETVNIPFFNGMPLGLIPAGYTQNAPQEVASDQAVRPDDDDDDGGPDTSGTGRKSKTPEEMNNTDLRIQKAILTGAGALFPLAKLFTTPQISKLDEEIDKRKESGIYDRKYDDIFDSEGLTGMFESDFATPEKFKTALDYVAPEGMSWNSDENTYKRDKDPFSLLKGTKKLDSDSGVNAFEITDSDAFVESGGIRPRSRPTTPGSTGSTAQADDSSSGDTKGFYESVTGVKFKDTAFGKAIGLSDDDDDDV
jgi:hypothetical protein